MAEQEKTRYSDSELQEFRELIERKLAEAREELKDYQDQILKKNTGSSDSDYKFNGLEDSSLLVEREYLSQQASRQAKFISHLEKALIRIENKTYGICRETGKLISPERLRIVPHATLSIEAKKSQNG
ncbi:MAG: TraR/DksA family transcriptional regulator [Chitinophagales bacterium]|nr:TraR/DksA family transcriptional regulator [Chitinophagales bacterium]